MNNYIVQLSRVLANPLRYRAGAILLALGLTSPSVQAGTWNVAGGGTWSTTGNWSGGVPGSSTTTTTNNTDTAQFGTTGTGIVTLDTYRNLKTVNFANAKAFTLTSGTLALTQAGIIETTLAGSASANINSLVKLEGTGGTFSSGYTSSSNTLNFGGNITSGATTGVTTLTLQGTNTGANTISGVISDGGGSNSVAVTENGTGNWILSNVNTYGGATQVSSGTLNLASTGVIGSGGGTAITVNGGTLNDNSTVATSGGITGTSSLAVSSGTAILSGANNFSGATQVSSTGVLQLQNANAIASSALTLSGGTLQLRSDTNNTTFADTSTTISGSTAIDVDELASGASGNTLKLGVVGIGGNTLTVTNNGGATNYNLALGAVTASASPTFTNNMTSGTLTLASLGSSSSSSLIAIFNGASASAVTVISGSVANGSHTVGITQSGAGTLVLTSASTYSGPTLVSNGVLQLQAANAISSSALTLSGGALRLRNDTNNATFADTSTTISGSTAIDVDALTGSGASGSTLKLGAISMDDHTLTVTNNGGANNYNLGLGAVTLTDDSSSPTFTNNLVNGTLTLASLTASGASPTVVFNGHSASAVTAVTGIISNGSGNTVTLTQSGANTLVLTGANTYTGDTTVSEGTLDLGNGGTSGSISASSDLILAGGTLNYDRSGTGNTQTFASTTFNAGASALTAGSGDTIALKGLTRNTFGVVDFGGAGSFTSTSTSANINGILGYATFGGTTWAVGPSTSGGAITGLTSYETTVAGGNTATNYSNKNVDVTSNPTLGATATFNSFRFNTAATETMTLATGNNAVNTGILVTSTVDNHLSTITGGTLRGPSGKDLVIIQNNTRGALEIDSIIANNGSGSSESSLTKAGPGAVILGATNSYTGDTHIYGGVLAVDGSLNSSSAVTVGGSGGNNSPTLAGSGTINGSLTVGGGDPGVAGIINPGAVEGTGAVAGFATLSLTKGGTFASGSTYLVDIGSGADKLAISGGDLTVNAGALLDFNVLGPLDQGLYTLISMSGSGNTINGSFTVNDLPAGYKLLTGNNTTLQLQALANAGFTSPTPAVINIISGASTTIGATLKNNAPTGGVALNVSLADSGSTAGTITGLTHTGSLTIAPTGTSSVAGTFTAGAAGTGTWGISNTDPNAASSTVTTGGTVNVYNHSAPSLAITSGNNASVIAGASPVVTATLSDTAGNTPAPLDVNTLHNLTGTSGTNAVASGGTTDYTVTGFSNTAGLNQTLNVSLNAGDSSTVIGGNPLTQQSTTVTYNVYNHATGGLTTGTLALGNVHAGYTGTIASSNSLTVTNGTVGDLRVNLQGSAPTSGKISLNDVSGIASGGSGTISATLGNGQGVGHINTPITYTFGDQSTLAGASGNVGTAAITVTGFVYSGQGNWIGTGAAGSWGTLSGTGTQTFGLNWDNGGSPGVDGGFKGVDTATFGTVTSSAVTVHLADAAPNLNAITFNGTTNYTIDSGTGSNGIILSQGTGAPLPAINVTSGSQTLAVPVELDNDTTATVSANKSLAITGQVTGTGKFTNAGTGVTTLSGDNHYSGGTTISAGTLYTNNTGGSATGSGAVTVGASGTLGGSGTISGPVHSSGTLASGAAQGTGYVGSAGNPTGKVNGTGVGGGLTLSSTLLVDAGSSLTFALGEGNSTGSTFASPNTNSTYLTTTGGAGSVTFGTGSQINIKLVDLAAGSPTSDVLQLRYQSPYLLISAGATTTANLAFNLYTTGGFDGNGQVLGIVFDTTGLVQGQMLTSDQYESNAFKLQVLDPSTMADITLSQNYTNLRLYLMDGKLEVVPEPGTWALMFGGLALLLFIQHRRRQT